MADDIITTFRRLRSGGSSLSFFTRAASGEIVIPRFEAVHVCISFVMVYIGVYFGLRQLTSLKDQTALAAQISLSLICVLYVWPLLKWLFVCVKTLRVDTEYFGRFPRGAQFFYGLVISFWLCGALDATTGLLKPLHLWRLLVPAGLSLCFMVWVKYRKQIPVSVSPTLPKEISDRFGLYLGTSTGILGHLGHGAGLKASQIVTLPLADAAQNILIFGGIGSGKTTRAIQPLLLQLLDQDCGGLIFDIKGDFKRAVNVIASGVDREITVIGPEHTKMNLVSGLTPEVAASFLKSALLLNTRGGSDAFWIDTASELCKNSLGILSFFPGRYSLSDLHAYLFDPAVREGVNDEARGMLSNLKERDSRLLKSYLSYYETIFSTFDDKVRSGVNASVAQVLSPFNHPDLVDAFCTDDKDAPLMEEVLNGTVYLVDMPLARWGLGGKVAYNFIKLRFFNAMQKRNSEASWNQDRPVFFMCDEFQEIVSASRDGLSDLNFWDKSRSSKCIGIISAQAVSSFYAAIGNHDVANTLIQNFRQKICFRTEDKTTIELLNHLLGRVEIQRVSHSQSEGSSSSINNYSSSKNSSTSTSTTERQVLNPQIFRTLGSNQAVSVLSYAGVSTDDVLETLPVFID
jgi:type IV secretory pathway TraG/TraD family ATPase VirD4